MSVHGIRNQPHILIAGGGIGGMTAALSLLHRGINCDIFEQASELREIGAGLWLSVNGARALFELGLEDEVRSATIEADERVIRLWNSGWTRWLYKRGAASATHQPYVLLRAQLLRMLVEAVRQLKPDAVHLDTRCTAFFQDDQKVRLAYDGGSAVGDVLIGADGVHSRVRETAFGQVAARYTNALAWRGLVPMERLPAHHRKRVVSTWVGPTAHCTVYPVKWNGGELMTFSGQVEHSDWQAESWSEKGTIEECLKDFAGWHEDIIQLISNAETLHKWGLFVREPLKKWTTGRVTLLGDACHSMVPYLGQGVNMAIEDACVLARCMEKYIDNPAQALLHYQNARMDRTAKTAVDSAAMQATFHDRALAEPHNAEEYIEKQWSPEKAKARYDWIYEYDATRVPI